MGSSHSAMKVLNKNILKSFIRKSDVSSTFCTSAQNIKLKGIEFENCKVLISQNSQTICDLDKITGFRNKTELLDTIKESMKNSLSELDQGTRDMLATTVSLNNQKMSMNTYITSIIETNITDETTSVCLASASADQMQKFNNTTITCTGENDLDTRFSQNVQIYQLASCVTNAVSDILKNDKIVTDAVSKSEQKTDITQIGLLNKNMLKLLGIVLGILLVIFLIGLYFYVKFQTSKVPV